MRNPAEPGFDRLGELMTRACQRNGVSAAVKQPAADHLLQIADLPADRRLRHVQLLRRLGKAEVTGRRLEDHDGARRANLVHEVLHNGRL